MKEDKLLRFSSHVIMRDGTTYVLKQKRRKRRRRSPAGSVSAREPKVTERREGYYESQIYPGLFFDKYRHDVELNGQACLTPKLYSILTLLDDELGLAEIDYLKSKCFRSEVSNSRFKSAISELNKLLANIGVQKVVIISKGKLLFQ